jgi:regulator of sirC expression with transglutaminase-like and TPR domain
MGDRIAEDLQRALGEPGDALAPAALAIAELEYPRLDPLPWIAQLNDFGREATRRVAGLANVRDQVLALNRFVFGTLGFAGNREQYLDPRNSYLNEVIERRLGIPITLSIVYIEVGRRAGLPLSGIGFPGHFLVGCDRDDDEPLVIDAFNGGTLLSEPDCRNLLIEHTGDQVPWHPSYLDRTERRAIVLRMLGNLKRAYVGLRSFVHARRASDLLLAVDPTAITELRDRGLLAYHLQDFSAALHDLEGYLKMVTRAEPPQLASALDQDEDDEEENDEQQEFKSIWEHVKNLRRRVASFN